MVGGECRQVKDTDGGVIEGIIKRFVQVIHMRVFAADWRSRFHLIVMSVSIVEMSPPGHGF
jgi:hypothetical protein